MNSGVISQLFILYVVLFLPKEKKIASQGPLQLKIIIYMNTDNII